VVAHLTQAMAHVERNRGCDVVNVCTGSAISVLELARAIMATGHRPAPAAQANRAGGGAARHLITHGPARPGDIRHSVGNPQAATRLLGVAARISLGEGLAKTVAAMAEVAPVAALTPHAVVA